MNEQRLNRIKETNICDECDSSFYKHTSKMENLCPECVSILYGYENCIHDFNNNVCKKCGFNGVHSEYVESLIKRSDDTSKIIVKINMKSGEE